jgi:uracil-DNA glycosylase
MDRAAPSPSVPRRPPMVTPLCADFHTPRGAAGGPRLAGMASAEQRREELKAVFEQAQHCRRCPQLAATRTTVVFGAGNADADLMFVGEAPGKNEDEQGLPFVGRAGQLLNTLLEEIGLERKDVFIANTLKCLRYNAQVQLGDGSWERIGRLVRTRYGGTVMSVGEDGRLVPRRVTGWHATPLAGRRVLRVTFGAAKRNGRGRAAVELTGDHPVLTERGYVAAEDLRYGDRVATGVGMSAVARDVVWGTLLGDGSISARAAHLTFGHSARQRSYAQFKAHVLREFQPRLDERTVAAVAGGEPTYPVVHVRTLAHRALGVARREFYAGRKIVPESMADELTERMLAIWFMDDGHTRIRKGRRPCAEIATVGFGPGDVLTLRAGLLRIGLATKAIRGRIHFDVEATEKLSEMIAPYVPESMRYKLHPGIETRIPFDPSRYDPGPPEVLYDDVEVEDITDTPRNDTTFFCIDVEDTHNFVTTGGVVHNCRPPGNRDPQPSEIDACQDYLFRQLELIEPKVICTLGNFSTKLLRADPTGIMRLHGRPEVRTIGPRAVRLYPIFHPAAALYKQQTLEVLRQDFARLPDLLALPAPPQPGPIEEIPEPEDVPEPEPELAPPEERADPEREQLGLF